MKSQVNRSQSWNLNLLRRRMSQVPYALISHLKRDSSILRSGGGFSLGRRLGSLILTLFLLACIYKIWEWGTDELNQTTIIIITPTHKRPERFADMTRFSQTLMHIKNIHWVVIEDANQTVPAVERILQRSRIPYAYFYTTTKPGFPRRGWTKVSEIDESIHHFVSSHENYKEKVMK